MLCSGAIAALIAMPSSVQAADAISYLSFSVGYFNVLDEDKAVDMRAEYRSAKSVVFENMHPYAGLEVTFDGSIWAGGGLFYDHSFAPGWYVTPSLGVGLYSQGGSDRDLGSALQFRSQLEISYEFENSHRASLAFSHISNASLGDKNPGSEVVAFYWHMPFDDVF